MKIIAVIFAILFAIGTIGSDEYKEVYSKCFFASLIAIVVLTLLC